MKIVTQTVFVGADHNGFALKQIVKESLLKQGYTVIDKGALILDEADDYPDIAFRVAKEVQKGSGSGVLICGSSIGVCIAANKVRGVRAGSVSNVKQMRLAREHDDVNVLCLAGWDLSSRKVLKIVDTFLKTPFSNEARHLRRIKKIERFEKRS